MAAAQRRFFKKSNTSNTIPEEPAKVSSGEPAAEAKKESLGQLKEQLSSIQSKIEQIEGGEKEDQIEVKTLYDWTSASHVFIPRGKKWLTYVILTTLLIILILLFVREFFIIAPVLAVAFLAYILASVPPENIEHKITNQGIITGKHNYLWEELYDFWFAEKHGQTILNIDTLVNFPARLTILINAKEKEKIKGEVLRYLPYREVPKTNWIDSLGDSLSNLFHKMAS